MDTIDDLKYTIDQDKKSSINTINTDLNSSA